MKLDPIEAAISDFLFSEILFDKDVVELGPEDSLIERSLLDSLAILKTVAFLEQNFDIAIPDEQLMPEHFETVRAMANLVRSQRAGP